MYEKFQCFHLWLSYYKNSITVTPLTKNISFEQRVMRVPCILQCTRVGEIISLEKRYFKKENMSKKTYISLQNIQPASNVHHKMSPKSGAERQLFKGRQHEWQQLWMHDGPDQRQDKEIYNGKINNGWASTREETSRWVQYFFVP